MGTLDVSRFGHSPQRAGPVFTDGRHRIFRPIPQAGEPLFQRQAELGEPVGPCSSRISPTRRMPNHHGVERAAVEIGRRSRGGTSSRTGLSTDRAYCRTVRDRHRPAAPRRIRPGVSIRPDQSVGAVPRFGPRRPPGPSVDHRAYADPAAGTPVRIDWLPAQHSDAVHSEVAACISSRTSRSRAGCWTTRPRPSPAMRAPALTSAV